MSRTGWGIRELSDPELAACFDLPDYVSWIDRFLRDLVPLQMCRAVIDFVTKSTSMEPPTVKHKPRISVGDISLPSLNDVIWLPLLGRWLPPGSWADAEIADKAVKSDNAPVDFRPWHRRIQLVMPCTFESIAIIERLATRRWRFMVISSLFRYLSITYGSDWFQTLIRGVSKKRIGDPHLAPGKRSRYSRRDHTEGDGSTRGVMWNQSTSGRAEKLVLASPAIDFRKGLRVLGQVISSTWWEWLSGSAPIFWRWN